MHYVRICILCIKKTQHQSLDSLGDGIKNESEMHASYIVGCGHFSRLLCVQQSVDG